MQLSYLSLQQALLHVVNSSTPFQLAAVRLEGNSSRLIIRSSTISTSCDLLQGYMDYNSLRSLCGNCTKEASSIQIHSYVAAQMEYTNVNITCNPSMPANRTFAAVASSMELFQTLTAVSQLGLSATVTLLSNISLNSSRSQFAWPALGVEITAGTLELAGIWGTPTILDFSMVPVFLRLAPVGAQVSFSNLHLINLCMDYMYYNRAQGIRLLTDLHMWPISFTRMQTKLLLWNTSMSVAQPGFYGVFMANIYPTPFPSMERYFQTYYFSGGSTHSPASIRRLIPDAASGVAYVDYALYGTAGASWENVVQSTYLNYALPTGMQYMPKMYCATQLPVPSEEYDQPNRTVAPMYLVADSKALMSALTDAATLSNKQFANTITSSSIYIPPIVLLMGNASVSAQLIDRLQFQRDAMIAGIVPFAGSPPAPLAGSPNNITLDTMRAVDMFVPPAAEDGSLMVHRMTLINLASRPLGYTKINPQGNTKEQYALPLWAFTMYSRSSTGIRMQLDSVTLYIPNEEYAILYLAARRGPNWRTVQSPLIQALENFVPMSPPTATGIMLSVYQGFSTNATRVLLLPEAPFDTSTIPPDTPPAAPPSPVSKQPDGSPSGGPSPNAPTFSEDSSSKTAIIAAIASVVGVVAIAAVAILVYFKVRKPPAKTPQKQDSLSDAEVGKGRNDSGDSTPTMPVLKNNGTDGAQGNNSVRTKQQNGTKNPESGKPGSQHEGLSEDLKSKSTQNVMNSKASIASSWDPHKEVQQLAQELQADTQKLTLLEPIGQGGYGTVYRGIWRGLEVAIKTVLFSENGDENARSGSHQRAVLEAAVCTSMVHQNIVTTYHYDITPVQPVADDGKTPVTTPDEEEATHWKLYLVQEFCHASLHDAIKGFRLHDAKSKMPDMDLVLEILGYIAKGMEYMHSKNIIHGDLKPENVLLKNDPTSPIGVTAKITDFGLCNTLTPGSTHITNVKNGTPFYVAPEITKTGHTTKYSDVYSFGVVMWEIYRGMPPWVRTQNGFVANRRFPSFSTGTPSPYMELCTHCLRSNPNNRPTFKEIIAHLKYMHTCFLEGYTSLQRPGVPGPGWPSSEITPASPTPQRPSSGRTGSSGDMAASSSSIAAHRPAQPSPEVVPHAQAAYPQAPMVVNGRPQQASPSLPKQEAVAVQRKPEVSTQKPAAPKVAAHAVPSPAQLSEDAGKASAPGQEAAKIPAAGEEIDDGDVDVLGGLPSIAPRSTAMVSWLASGGLRSQQLTSGQLKASYLPVVSALGDGLNGVAEECVEDATDDILYEEKC